MIKIGEYYKISKGLSGSLKINKITFTLISFFYLVILLYIGLFYEITWVENTVPDSIKFGGYRDVEISTFISLINFMVCMFYLFEIHILGIRGAIFTNRATIRILNASGINSRKIYFLYTFRRYVDALLFGTIFIIPVVFLLAIKYSVFVYTLITYIYILFFATILIITVFDLISFITKKVIISNFFTVLIIIFASVIPYILNSIYIDFKWGETLKNILQILPDPINISYQYLLIVFSVTHNIDIILFPILFYIISLLALYLVSNKFLDYFSQA